MNLADTDFELFAIEPRFAQQRLALDQRWRDLQAQVHPDRFASQGAAAQRVAMQWALRVNEAYQRLKDPVRRAAYLCELHGAPIDAETNTAMPMAFLTQQLAWREALQDCQGAPAVQALANEVATYRAQALAQLERAIDELRDYAGAAAQVRGLMFVDRFVRDVDARLEALGL
jgi:molecular chaperone HscB